MPLPINVEFAAAYLDGTMEAELPEIAKQWATVRAYLQGADTEPASDDDILIMARTIAAEVVRSGSLGSVSADLMLAGRIDHCTEVQCALLALRRVRGG